MKIRLNFGNIFRMAGIIFMMSIIALFVNAAFGNIILICTAIMLLLTLISMIMGHNLKINVFSSSDVYEKGENADLNISVETALPICLLKISIKLFESEFLISQSPNAYGGFCTKGSPLEIKAEYKTAVYGEDIIGIESLVISDLFGIISLVKKEPESIKIKTLPVLKHVMYPRQIMTDCIMSSDFDDTEEFAGTSVSAAGTPGFEHRAYIEGDNVKRINYKLSAKKGELLVRLDEPVSVSKTAIVLDNKAGKRKDTEKIAEGMLAFVDFAVSNNVCCDVYICNNERYNKLRVFSENDIKGLIDMTAEACFFGERKINADINTNGASSIVIFTHYADDYSEDLGLKKSIVTSDITAEGENIYFIDDELNLIKEVI